MRRRPARLALAGAALAAMVALDACWSIPALEGSGLVSLLAIDPGPAGDYQVTVAMISPPGGSAPGFGGSTQGSPVLIRAATATTVATAIRDLDAQTYLALDLTHLQVVVVSAALARAGLAAALSGLADDPATATGAWLAVARGGSAASVLQGLRDALPQPGAVLFETLTNGRVLSPYRPSHLFTFFARIQIQGGGPTTVGIDLGGGAGPPTGTGPAITGLAMFRADRLVGWLDGDAAVGWALATARTLHPTVTVPGPPASFAFEVQSDQRRITVRHTADGPEVKVAIQVTGRLVAPPNGPYADLWGIPGQLGALQKAAATRVEDDVRAALHSAQAAGADVFSLGQYVRVYDPQDWQALGATWDESAFPHLPVQVVAHVVLRNVGDLVCPILGPC